MAAFERDLEKKKEAKQGPASDESAGTGSGAYSKVLPRRLRRPAPEAPKGNGVLRESAPSGVTIIDSPQLAPARGSVVHTVTLDEQKDDDDSPKWVTSALATDSSPEKGVLPEGPPKPLRAKKSK